MIAEISRYSHWISHESIKQRVGASARQEQPILSTDTLPFIQTTLGEKSSSPKHLDNLVQALRDYQKQAPTIAITLAAPAPSHVRRELTAWCRKNLGASTLITFSFNQTLLGGMVVRSGSRIFDWSLKRALLEKKESFAKGFADVR